MPIIAHQNQIIGQATNAEVLVKDTIGWTGKNLCNIKKGRLGTTVHSYPVTLNGITFNMLEDGTLSVTGTSTSLTFLGFSLISKGFTVGQKLKLSGVTSGDYENKCSLSIRYNADDIVVGDSNTQGETLITLTQEAINADDLHVTLRIPNNATVNEIVSPMVRKADITDPTYEPYHESVEVMHEEEIHGVNLFNDSKIEVGKAWNGDTNANRARNIISCEPNSEYIVSMNGTNGLDAVFFSVSASIPPSSQTAITSFPYTIRTGASDKYITFGFNKTNIALSDVTALKIMLRKADIEDSTYRPYNHQAIQNQLNAQGVLGAKNLLENTATSGTYNGITFTKNSDESVTFNGTATDLTWRTVCSIKLPVGKYILNGCPAGGDTGPATYCIALWNTDGGTAGSIINVRDAGDGVVVNITQELTYSVNIGIAKGQTVNNLTFYPMLRLASDPDDTYQPYAMTNKELTEKAGVWTTPVSCLVGDTTCTITNSAIHTTSTIRACSETSSGEPVGYKKIVATEGQVVIAFASALTEAANIKLNVLNV